MDARLIAEGIAASGQITTDDVAAIKAAGYRSIICNRPEGESADQTPSADVAAEAAAQGLAFRFIPVSPMTGITPANIADTTAALDALPRPIFTYCRSGARSANLYQAAVMHGAKA